MKPGRSDRSEKDSGTASVRALLERAAALMERKPDLAASLASEAAARLAGSADSALAGEAAFTAAQAYWRAAELRRCERELQAAMASFERAGQRARLGAAYRLHSMIFIAQDKVSLALAAAIKALGYPDVGAKERAQLYTTVAICFHHLIDLPTGRQVLEEYAWAEAQRSNDPTTVLACAARCVGLMHAYACWAMNVPHASTVGAEKPKLESAATYLAYATKYWASCEANLDAAPASYRIWALGQKGLLIALRDGWPSAEPIFNDVLTRAAEFPRELVASLTYAGTAARIAREWKLARGYLERARSMPAAELGYHRRVIAHESSLVYQALDEYDAAIDAMRAFAHLQTSKARLGRQWINDDSNVKRYGERVDPATVYDSMFRSVQPAAMKRALAYVETNLRQRLLLRDVARQVSVSVRTLQQLFRAHQGVPISDFIRERRMQRAQELLARGNEAVSAVAEEVGYTSAANFSRDYRKRFGRTPSSVRKSASGAARRFDRFRIADTRPSGNKSDQRKARSEEPVS